MHPTRTAKLFSLVAGATAVVGLLAGSAHADPAADLPLVDIPPIDWCVEFPGICDGDLTNPTTDPTPDPDPQPDPEPTGETDVPEAPPAVVVEATPNFTG